MQNFCRICQLWLHISIRCTSWLTFPYWGGYPATFDVLHASGRVMLMKVPPILGPPSTTIHSILQVQFTCLTVIFHNLSPGPLVYLLVWNPLFHTPHISSLNHYLFFCKTCPRHRNLFCWSNKIMWPIPNLSLSSILGNLFFS